MLRSPECTRHQCHCMPAALASTVSWSCSCNHPSGIGAIACIAPPAVPLLLYIAAYLGDRPRQRPEGIGPMAGPIVARSVYEALFVLVILTAILPKSLNTLVTLAGIEIAPGEQKPNRIDAVHDVLVPLHDAD